MNLSLTLLGFYPGVVHAVGIAEQEHKVYAMRGKPMTLFAVESAEECKEICLDAFSAPQETARSLITH